MNHFNYYVKFTKKKRKHAIPVHFTFKLKDTVEIFDLEYVTSINITLSALKGGQFTLKSQYAVLINTH